MPPAGLRPAIEDTRERIISSARAICASVGALPSFCSSCNIALWILRAFSWIRARHPIHAPQFIQHRAAHPHSGISFKRMCRRRDQNCAGPAASPPDRRCSGHHDPRVPAESWPVAPPPRKPAANILQPAHFPRRDPPGDGNAATTPVRSGTGVAGITLDSADAPGLLVMFSSTGLVLAGGLELA